MRICLTIASMMAPLAAAAVIATLTGTAAAKTLRSYQDDRFGTAAAVEYPARMQRTYDPLAAVVSRTLEPAQQNCG